MNESSNSQPESNIQEKDNSDYATYEQYPYNDDLTKHATFMVYSLKKNYPTLAHFYSDVYNSVCIEAKNRYAEAKRVYEQQLEDTSQDIDFGLLSKLSGAESDLRRQLEELSEHQQKHMPSDPQKKREWKLNNARRLLDMTDSLFTTCVSARLSRPKLAHDFQDCLRDRPFTEIETYYQCKPYLDRMRDDMDFVMNAYINFEPKTVETLLSAKRDCSNISLEAERCSEKYRNNKNEGRQCNALWAEVGKCIYHHRCPDLYNEYQDYIGRFTSDPSTSPEGLSELQEQLSNCMKVNYAGMKYIRVAENPNYHSDKEHNNSSNS
eukprot:gb/GECH01001339.1/.p1 GENE.gb/GECH01001339.1/~~gb/GECH01001339.1/.p1  ORF type:complete len:322 (+),score=80.54 gb/GECH01001339.1/:1-966(+)